MNRLEKSIGMLVLWALFQSQAYAQEEGPSHSRRWYVPDFIPVQYAGNIGVVSTGAGYSTRTENYHLGLMYGYVPKAVGGAYIHTVTAKNTFPITRYAMKNNRVLVPYLGLGLSVELSGNAFFRQPPHFPESYYDFPKNLHVLAYGGVKVQHTFDESWSGLRGVEFFAEAGTIDLYVWYKSMSREIRFNEIFSMALGVNLLLPQ